MASATTVLFIPGAWHTAQAWSKVEKELKAHQYNTQLLDLPSVGPKVYHENFDQDVAAVRNAINSLVNAGQKVVVACHSYGGIPVSQAVEGFSFAKRAETGLRGGVTHLIYCCAFIINEGNSLIGTFGGDPLPWFQISEDRTYCNPIDPKKVFYNDLSAEEADEATQKLRPFSFQCFYSELKYAGWKHVPTTFLYCTNDQAVPMEVQRLMVEEFAKGYDIHTYTLESSHSPMLSMPEKTAATIRKAIET